MRHQLCTQMVIWGNGNGFVVNVSRMYGCICISKVQWIRNWAGSLSLKNVRFSHVWQNKYIQKYNIITITLAKKLEKKNVKLFLYSFSSQATYMTDLISKRTNTHKQAYGSRSDGKHLLHYNIQNSISTYILFKLCMCI